MYVCRPFSDVAMVNKITNSSWSCKRPDFPPRGRKASHLPRFQSFKYLTRFGKYVTSSCSLVNFLLVLHVWKRINYIFFYCLLFNLILFYYFVFLQDFTAKLSDFGLAIDGPEGDETHVTTRVMGTQGYAAPEYIMTGKHNTRYCMSLSKLIYIYILLYHIYDSHLLKKKKN